MHNKDNKEKNKMVPFRTPFQYIWFISRPHWYFPVSAILITIFASTLSQSTNYLFKLIVDAIESNNQHVAFLYGLAFPVAVFLVQSLYRVSGLLTMKWSTRVRLDGYSYFFSHTLKHSHTYFLNRFTGSIHTKIRNIVDGVDQLIPDIVWTFVDSLASLFITFIFIYAVDPMSAFLFAGLVVALILMNRLLAPRKMALAKENAAASSTLHAHMIDIFSNVSATRQYTRGAFEERHVQELAEAHRVANTRSWTYTEKMLFLNGLVLFGFMFAMFYTLIVRWGAGGITTGDFVLVASLVSRLSGTLIFIGRSFNSSARTLGEVREGFAEILVPFDVTDAPNAHALAVTQGEVVFKNVTFTYDTNVVFDAFNMRIAPGERVGLVGPSGAGKTTFVSLLLRQQDIGDGAIMIDGSDISTVTQDSLREAIAVVPQEPMLFHRTIKANIAYGNPHATDEEIIESAKKAQAHEFISALPLGYDTLVGERGVKLSGGQKQRVAIARAILKDAPILVLDEATSALDSESESEIQKALHILMAGKTVVAIAHRLSTLREMDRIVVLEHGKIIEDGSHQTLKEYGGTYARLWNHQAGGFLKEDEGE